jgi:G3E family GTPase
MNPELDMVPVTILTGFLGAGKTTLLNRILREMHGHRIAVIENEFGEAGIDNEILLQDSNEQIVEMNNGCICCSVRGDLVRMLEDLSSRRRRGELSFERVVIETTGLADPSPVAQTFLVEETVASDYLLDAIVTVVDAKHAQTQLDQFREAQEQVGFADRILLSKTDLVGDEEARALIDRLRGINPRAPVSRVDFGKADIESLLDIRAFNINAVLELDPGFLDDVGHEHDDSISSFVFRSTRPFDADRLEEFFNTFPTTYGKDLLRYKGILHVAGNPRRMVFQGVHMLVVGTDGSPWEDGESRESVMVFIGRNLPKITFERALTLCVEGGAWIGTRPA